MAEFGFDEIALSQSIHDAHDALVSGDPDR
jgi:hypothetical protein